MDLLVVVIVLAAIAMLAGMTARQSARLGIIHHQGDGDVIATAADVEERLAGEDALAARRESEWRHWYQLGNS